MVTVLALEGSETESFKRAAEPMRPYSIKTKWTTERVTLLQELCSKNESYKRIMIEINQQTGATFTRNACLGKAKRMGLEKGPCAQEKTDKPETPKRPKRTVTRRQRLQAKRRQVPRIEVVSDFDLYAIPPRSHYLHQTFEQLALNGCRYSCSGGEKGGDPKFFCGQPQVKDKSWCVDCCEIVFAAPTAALASERRQLQARVFG